MLNASIRKELPNFTVDIELRFDNGILVFFGPSGSGKSTILNCLAGLQKPSAGRILLNNRVFFCKQQRINVPARQRRIGYVFQDYALFPHLTALQNVEYGLKASGVERQTADEKAQQYLALVGLQEEQHKYPEMLSGGQKQRIALARALANEPGVLLLDEPLSHLDPESRSQLQLELKELQEKTGVTMLLVTHNMTEAALLGHKVSFLRRGTIEKTVNIKAFV